MATFIADVPTNRRRTQVIADQRQRCAGPGVERAERRTAAHAQRLPEQRTNRRALERPMLPGQTDLESAGRSQPCDLTVRPRRGQRRQQPDLPLVALQQHLGDGRRAAEVAVDLERRVRVEHVGIGALGAEQELQDVVGVVAVGEPRPEIDPPRRRPARRLIAANFERPFHGRGELRRAPDVDVVAGKQAEQVRDMPVMDLGRLHVPVVEPFLQLAGAADLQRRQPRASGAPRLPADRRRSRACAPPRSRCRTARAGSPRPSSAPSSATCRTDAGSPATARAR